MSNFFIKNLPAFKDRNFKLFIVSQILSLSGGFVQNVALSWLVFEASGSGLYLSIFLFLCYLPIFLLSYPAGALCDRVSIKAVLVTTEIILAIMSGGLFTILLFYKPPFWFYAVFGFVWGVVRAVQSPAAAAIPKRIVKNENSKQEEMLKSAVALNNLALSLARGLGPLVAALVYAKFAGAGALFVNFISYIPSLYCLISMQKLGPAQAGKKQKQKLKNVLGFKKPALYLLLLALIISFFATNYNLVLAKLTNLHGLSSTAFALLMSCLGAGALIGAIVLCFTNIKLPAAFSGIAISTLCILLAFLKQPALLYLTVTVYGFFDYCFFTVIINRLQQDCDASMVARVMSIYLLITTGALPLGTLSLGTVIDKLGVTVLLYLIAGISLTLQTLVLILKKWALSKAKSG